MNSSLVGSLAWMLLRVAVFAGDLLDAPGPGYRNQAESLRAPLNAVRPPEILRDRPTYRFDLLDALPPSRLSPEERARRQKLFLQRVDRFRGIRIFTNPLPLSIEIQRLSPTLPELPTENPFKGTIRLFDAK